MLYGVTDNKLLVHKPDFLLKTTVWFKLLNISAVNAQLLY